MNDLVYLANITIPKPDNRQATVHYDGNTHDIIETILSMNTTAEKQLQNFAKYFQSDSLLNTSSLIWNFIKKNIKYSKDPAEIQLIKAPSQLWATKKGDCKSMALFVAGILFNLKIPFAYRFTSYSKNNEITHVYIIIHNFKTGQNIIIDPVYTHFNSEKKFSFNKDIEMVKIATITGTEDNKSLENKIPKIPALHAALKINIPFIAGRTATLKLIEQNIAFLNQKNGIATQMYNLINAGKKYTGTKILLENESWNFFKRLWYNLGGDYDASKLAEAIFSGASKPLFRLNLKDPGRAFDVKKYGIGDGGAALITGSFTTAEIITVILAALGALTAYFNTKNPQNTALQDPYLTNYYDQNQNLMPGNSDFPEPQNNNNFQKILPYAAAGAALLLLAKMV